MSNWTICQWIDYVFGPEVEGETQETSYATRWGVWLNVSQGTVEYGISGQPRQPAPTDLFPVDLVGANAISLAFDQDAEPVFAIGFEDNHIEIRRIVVGVPTTYTFTGKTPRLFFNGILLPQNSPDTDIVCYYVLSNVITSRYQRDNFGVAYQATNFPFPVEAIKKVDSKSYRELMFVQRLVNPFASANYELRSPPYPLPPVPSFDSSSIGSTPTEGRYLDVIVEGGSYLEDSELGSEIESGSYMDTIVDATGEDDDDASLGSSVFGEYTLVIINGGTSEDDTSIASALTEGEYVLIVIQGGDYQDPSELSSQITSGSYTPA